MNSTTRTFFIAGAIAASLYGFYSTREDLSAATRSMDTKIQQSTEYVKSIVEKHDVLHAQLKSVQEQLQAVLVGYEDVKSKYAAATKENSRLKAELQKAQQKSE